MYFIIFSIRLLQEKNNNNNQNNTEIWLKYFAKYLFIYLYY